MNFIAWSIVLCEILFWVFIIVGLFSRYIFKKEKVGLLFLALTPVIDLVLLIVAGYDLLNGAVATKAHGIAAVYIGVSIMFGKSMIQWADERFSYYVTKQGPMPKKRIGMEFAKHYFKGWVLHLFAYLIGTILLIGLTIFIDDSTRTEALMQVFYLWSLVLGVDLLISISYFVWRKK